MADINFESARVERLFHAAKVALFVHGEPCRSDHNGLCQAHGLDPVEHCWVARLRSALGEFDREGNRE